MFTDKGSIIIETINEKSIKDFLKYHFNKWVAEEELKKLKENYLTELKYFIENDKTEIHNIDINHLHSEKSQMNDVLIWELKGIKEVITTIKRIFDYLQFDVYDILNKKELIENYNYFNFTATDRKSVEILKDILNDKTKLKDVTIWDWKYRETIKEIINKSERTTQIYMLILMYLAYNDIESFLIDNIDFSLKTENNELTKQTETSLYPFLTPHGKYLFEEYLRTSTDYNDISFIFYQLTERIQPEMVKMRFREYIDWLKENKYISEKMFNNIDKKTSLNKKSNAQFRIDKLNEIESRLKKVE